MTVEFITYRPECDLVKCKFNKEGLCHSAIIIYPRCFQEDKSEVNNE